MSEGHRDHRSEPASVYPGVITARQPLPASSADPHAPQSTGTPASPASPTAPATPAAPAVLTLGLGARAATPSPVVPAYAALPLVDAAQACLDDLRYMRNASKYTIRGYGDDFHLFIRVCEESLHPGTAATLADLTIPTIRAFVLWCAKAGRAPKSTRHYVTTLRTLCRFLTEQGALTYNPALSVQPPKVPQTKADVGRDEDLATFLAIIPDTKAGRMYRVFFRVLLESGMRIGEAVAVKVADVDLEAAMLYVRQGKGRKDRIIPLTQGTAETVRAYLQGMRAKPASDEDAAYLWLSRTGRAVAKSTVRTAMNLFCARAGLDACRIHPHAWRAAFASRLARQGVPITVIQELMGHANIDTTAHYIGTAPGAMREAVEKATLRP